MKVIFCHPDLTMNKHDRANEFFESCREILDMYVTDIRYVSSSFHVDQLLAGNADADDIFVFFNSEDGEYENKFRKLIKKYGNVQSRVWAIAMEKIQSVGVLQNLYPISRVLMSFAGMRTEIQ